MSPFDLLTSCILAALLGVFGQGLRAAAGIKKRADEAAEQGKPLGDWRAVEHGFDDSKTANAELSGPGRRR